MLKVVMLRIYTIYKLTFQLMDLFKDTKRKVRVHAP